ncbi:hypothetical protein [Jiulongibacter sp. NS-SX5]|uniref:hypothetical protein n=1 Tax=Jiulongibacter sp. NS-SX5 TaxID=3463854 RepID=UPI004057DA80
MRNFYVFLCLLAGLSSCVSTSLVRIPANSSVEIDYPAYDAYMASLSKSSPEGIAVAVLSKETGEQVRGFGLNGKANVMVEAENKLVLTNDSPSEAVIKWQVEETERWEEKDDRTYVSFSLLNKSAQSIPLIIPTVMNPNLSPFSKSGVDLAIGQKIYFKYKGKRYTLLTVDRSIADGAELEVDKIIKRRKEELKLK